MGKKSWKAVLKAPRFKPEQQTQKQDEDQEEEEERDTLQDQEDLEMLREFGSSVNFLETMNFEGGSSQQKVKRQRKPIIQMEEEEDTEEDEEEEDSEAEADYERIPRVVTIEDESITKLPIKNAEGKIVQEKKPVKSTVLVKAKIAEREKEQSDRLEANIIAAAAKLSKAIPATRVEKQSKKPKLAALNEIKENLASLASLLLEDPEQHVAELRNLAKHANDPRPAVVQYTLLAQLAVYIDIIPGYRIRKLTDAEQSGQVSKEVRKLRNFEETLLSNYQSYLQNLESNLKKFQDNPQLVLVAVTCMGQLLTSVTHFNYRLNIMTVVVKYMNQRNNMEAAKVCCDSVVKLFKDDETGEASLECVKLIADMIHTQKYQVIPIIVDTFQHLRLQSELSNTPLPYGKKTPKQHKPANERGGGKKRKGDDKVHVTKKQKKVNRHLAQAMVEVQEAEAVYDKDARKKVHSETLKFVFLTYFRILKNLPNSPLIPHVLEGLARFAHLINVDFFQDLLNVLKSISITQHEMYLEGKDSEYSSALSALHCIIAAFELLDSVGGALSIDLRDFYTALYTQISRLAVRPGAFDKHNMGGEGGSGKASSSTRNEIELLMSGLESMIKKNREMPAERIAAFVKRIATLSISTPGNSALACLFQIRTAIARFPRLESLVDEEGRVATGIYDPYLDDPNLCNPFATSLWELVPLLNHFHPAVSGLAKDISKIRNDFIGTNLNIAKIYKSKGTAIQTFGTFRKRSGFSLYPQVEIPANTIQAQVKKLKGRLDGPTFSFQSDFMLSISEL